MIIHTVKQGENLKELAVRYLAPLSKIAECNDLDEGDGLIPGEEILIPIATRTYTVQGLDTVARIAKRFGIKKQALLANNPHLYGKDELKVGDVLVIKYENENLGTLAANGYISPSCPEINVSRAIPYIIYGTVSGSFYDEEIRLCPGASKLSGYLTSNGRIPLLRIYDKSGGRFLNEGREKFIDDMIKSAKENGFMGIVLAAYDADREHPDTLCDFIVATRRKMIGCDLIFFLEGTSRTNKLSAELSDGGIISFGDTDGTSISEYENALLKYSQNAESSKILVDIPTYAIKNGNYHPLEYARRMCRSSGGYSTTSKDGKLSSFVLPSGEHYEYESLSNIKAKLERLPELGYMGVSFDVENTPISYIMMLYTMFKPIGYIEL